MAYGFGDAEEHLAVVDLECHGYAQIAENAFHDLDEFQFAQQAAAADDIYVALVEFTVATFLRSVGTPYGLYLITAERECYLALVLHDVTSQRYRKVVA